jgi:predicted ATPase
MFLKSIRLVNVKCFEELDLSFQLEDGSMRKWTVLLGENGLGKSTLLKAIALVACGSEALTDLLTEPREWVRNGAEACEISAVLVTKQMEERNISLRIEREDLRKDVLFRNQESLSLIDRALAHASRNYFLAGYGAYRRYSSRDSRLQLTSGFHDVRAQSVATLFDPDATVNPIESWAMDLDYLENGTATEVIRDVLNGFLPNISFNSIDKKRGRLLFDTPDGIVPLELLSESYQSVVSWVGDLVYRVMQTFGDYRSPLSTRGLLLIDEIDLHLHPKWQRALLSFLDRRLPNFQLIVTTHSPVTAQQAGPGQLHYLTRPHEKIQIEQFTGDPRTLLVNQLLMTDVFGVESDESLEVQEKKARYAELRSQRSASPQEQAEMEELANYLTNVPQGGRSNLVLQEEQADLLRAIGKELRERKP